MNTDDRSKCRNCGTPLDGEYCGQCGQRESGGDFKLSEVLGNAVDDLVSLDSRLYRTLTPLLFKPGFLTAEFNNGRRARYVAPFRLYLIISFLLFAFLSAGSSDNFVDESEGRGPIISIDSDDEEFASIDIGGDENLPPWAEKMRERFETGVARVNENPEQFISQLVDQVPQLMFLLLPVFALLVKAAYLFSPFHYMQHLVFSLHYHCFAFLLYLFASFLPEAIGGGKEVGFLIILFLYLSLALRRVYVSSPMAAAAKAFFIFLADGLVVLISSVVFLLVNLFIM
jgi:hypothetical protein